MMNYDPFMIELLAELGGPNVLPFRPRDTRSDAEKYEDALKEQRLGLVRLDFLEAIEAELKGIVGKDEGNEL